MGTPKNMDQLYCDCLIGTEAHNLHEAGWIYIPKAKPHQSVCLKCMDTGVIPTVYCTCLRGGTRSSMDQGGPIHVLAPDLEPCDICLGCGVVAGGKEFWSQEIVEVKRVTPSGLDYYDLDRIITRSVEAPSRPVQEFTTLGLARLDVAARDLARATQDDDGVVDFEAARAAREHTAEMDESLPQAVVEIVWGQDTFSTAFQMLKCPDGEAAVLLPAETPAERITMIKQIRWVLNYQALLWNLRRLIREEDWMGDRRE